MVEDHVVYCSVCGVYIPYFDKWRASKTRWLQNVIFLTSISSSEAPETREEGEDREILIIPSVLQPASHGLPIAGHFDHEANKFTQHVGMSVFRNTSLAETNNSHGYPIHESCWSILNFMLQAAAASTVSEKELHKKLYKILDNTAYSEYKLFWPHEYYGLARYQPSDYWQLPLEFPFTEDDPLADISPLLESTTYEPFLLPDFLPLPAELRLRIFNELDPTDIRNIKCIPSIYRAAFPDYYWKKFTLPTTTTEFGYLNFSNSSPISSQYSWYHLLQVAKRQFLSTGHLQNRHRIWKICRDISFLVVDTVNSEPTNLTPVDFYEERDLLISPGWPDMPHSFTAWSESRGYDFGEWRDYEFFGTFALFSGETSTVPTEEIVLHYTGAGDMQYISGIQLLPSDQQVGYLTGKTRALKTIDMEFLSVATSQYGLVDVSLSKLKDEYNWKDGKHPTLGRDKIAITRRTLRPSNTRAREIRVFAKLDATKITILTFRMEDIIPQDELDDLERQFQMVSWTPTIPKHIPSTLGAGYGGRDTWECEKFRPCEVISFDDRKVERVTGWSTLGDNALAGITVHFEEEAANPPSSMGDVSSYGSVVDFLVNGEAGEYIESVEVITGEEFSVLVGLKFTTNWGREGHLSPRTHLNNRPVSSWPVQIPQGHKITGFYGDFDKSELCLGYFGVLSAPVQYQPRPKNTLLHTSSPGIPTTAVLKGTIYSSTAPLHPCREITCYSTNYPRFRLTGLLLEYQQGDNEATLRHLVGSIGNSMALPEKLVLGESEQLTKIEWDTHTLPFSTRQRLETSLASLKITTSKGNSITWGILSSNRVGHISLKYKIGGTLEVHPKSTLRWDYDKEYDHLMTETELSPKTPPLRPKIKSQFPQTTAEISNHYDSTIIGFYLDEYHRTTVSHGRNIPPILNLTRIVHFYLNVDTTGNRLRDSFVGDWNQPQVRVHRYINEDGAVYDGPDAIVAQAFAVTEERGHDEIANGQMLEMCRSKSEDKLFVLVAVGLVVKAFFFERGEEGAGQMTGVRIKNRHGKDTGGVLHLIINREDVEDLLRYIVQEASDFIESSVRVIY
ncbi:hypothetical protein H072_9060 [Dactylellina haptotyla CBS 200.50]|uniref:F-box domain-containing protein n=1 Tax=Dactylellina haptotyla (strain CBS 200.50) TaxID=1284197 RepID=S8BDJ4_DACHA|nr:hypothetical protein H072_9060 [Dactylellina haptotyla CBS 200.50]